MKNCFTKNLLNCFIFLVTLGFSFAQIHAQTLQEIPNPNGFTLGFFSGGGDGDLFFNYNDPNFYTELFYYDQMDLTQVPFDDEMQFPGYTTTYNDKFYFNAFDFGFNQMFLEYDGDVVTTLPLPTGFQFSGYVGEFNDLMFITLFDLNFNNLLFSFDGVGFTQIGTPANQTFGNFIGTANDFIYLSFFNTAFEQSIWAFDGNTFTQISSPAGVEFSFLINQNDTDLYLTFFNTSSFNNELFILNSITNTLTAVPSPTGFQFNWVNYIGDDFAFLEFTDANFNIAQFIWDGTSLDPLPIPTGFQFPFFINEFDDRSFFSMFDINFDQVMFSYDGTDFTQINSPAGSQLSNYADTLNGKAYYLFFDQNFNTILVDLEAGSNTVTEVPGPAGFTFNDFATSLDEKLFLSYFDNNFVTTLFFFDGNDFIEIENPDGKQYGFYLVDDLGELYLRYNDINIYSGTLYKLRPNSIPTSSDNSVTTFINIPYLFSENDFSFADSDGDTLTSILITQVEAVGNLFYNGAHVYVGDEIPFNDLDKITFFPNTDEEGPSYDVFSFKVFDGDDYSDLSYNMVINVIDAATSTEDNFLNANTLLFPVPADDFITLNIEATQSITSLNIRLISMDGKTIMQQQFDNIGNEFQHTFEMSGLPTGQYILHGVSPKGLFTKPVIVK